MALYSPRPLHGLPRASQEQSGRSPQTILDTQLVVSVPAQTGTEDQYRLGIA